MEEGKVTSGQEGLQPVAVRDDNFSGPSGGGNRSATLAGPARVFATQNRSDAMLPRVFGYFLQRK